VIWTVPRIWDGGTCFIIGGGDSMPRQFGVPQDVIAKVQSGELRPAAYSPYMEAIHGRRSIAVNNAYLIGEWMDAMFFGDCGWHLQHRVNLARWRKLKVTCCPKFANRPLEEMEGIKYLIKDSSNRLGLTTKRRMVSWNHNSGAAAINLAVHLGATRVVLLGFDMSLGHRGASHWHPGHGARRSPPFERHLRGFPDIARDAERLGVEIINACPDSAIEAFPRVELKEVIDEPG